ncbi:hypothetical protein [Brevibacterium daeguense]|nr:hypothetical protein [Brevibacterium daeguense]
MRTVQATPARARRAVVQGRRWVLMPILLFLIITGFPLPGTSPAAAAPAGSAAADQAPAGSDGAAQSLVVIGASGLSLGDIDPETTPRLHAFAEQAAMANLSVRSLTSSTCPASGWLTLGAGVRAGAVELPDPDEPASPSTPLPPPGPAGQPVVTPDAEEPAAPESTAQPTNYVRVPPRPEASCPEIRTPEESGEDLSIPGFERITTVNAASGYSPELGTMAAAPYRLAETAGDTGEADAPPAPDGIDRCTQAIGPGAAYAAASPEGSVRQWQPGPAELGRCQLALVDVGSVGSRSWLPEKVPLDHEPQLRRTDRQIGHYLDQIDLATTDVVIVGPGDTIAPSRLRALLAAGPSYQPGILSSSSTRQHGVAQLTDIAAATLTRVEGYARPAGASEAVFTVDAEGQTGREALATLQAAAAEAGTVHAQAQTFSVFLDVVHYLLFAVLGVGLLGSVHRRVGSTGSRRIHRGLGWAGLVLSVIPMGSFLSGLFPWARLPDPTLGLWLAIAAGSALLLAVAFVGPWRRTFRGRVAAICLTSAAVLAIDIAIGSQLQFNSLMGYNPIVGGRFYGLGNQGAALFIVALFLGLGLLAGHLVRSGRRGWAVGLISAAGLLSVGTLGNPAWGAKFGGTIATLVGFLVLLALVLGIRLNLWRLLLIGAISLAAILGIAGIDYLRPPEVRSHFGMFFGQLLDGELFAVIGRKLSANLNIMVINPALALVVPLAVIATLFFLAYLAKFPRTAPLARPWVGRLPAVLADPTLHAGFLAAAIGLAVGLVITDSGIAVPASGAMMLVPLLLALCADETPADPHGSEAPQASAAPASAAAQKRRREP